MYPSLAFYSTRDGGLTGDTGLPRGALVQKASAGSQVPGSDAAAQYVVTTALLALLVRDAPPNAMFETPYLPFRDIPTVGPPTRMERILGGAPYQVPL